MRVGECGSWVFGIVERYFDLFGGLFVRGIE